MSSIEVSLSGDVRAELLATERLQSSGEKVRVAAAGSHRHRGHLALLRGADHDPGCF